MADEKGWKVDMDSFQRKLKEQIQRSRDDAAINTDDWVELNPGLAKLLLWLRYFRSRAEIIKYRHGTTPKKQYYQIVFTRPPFYAESGGQVGDRGWIISGNEEIEVHDTIKENNLVIHIVPHIPSDVSQPVLLKVDKEKRRLTANNHSATHLLHAALRKC
jgi:alanyl-tRNA synthetase